MTLTIDRRLQWFIIVVAGCTAFAAVRMTSMLPAPHYGAWSIVGSVTLPLLQEAVFRGYLYGKLERLGPAAAIVVSAALFALFHIPRYGVGVLPLDFGAGLILGWQRWASGSWAAPAATHAFANLVQLW